MVDFFYEPVKDLLRTVPKYWHKFQVNRATKRVQEANMSFKDPQMHRFLKWKYGQEEILERCGEIYPVVTFRAPKTQRNNLNSLAISLTYEEQSFITKDTQYRSLIEKGGGRLLVNRPTYTMINLPLSLVKH